jgi:hypothetical protein
VSEIIRDGALVAFGALSAVMGVEVVLRLFGW